MENFSNYIQIDYFVATYAAIFLYLKFGIERTKSIQKRLISLAIGAILGIVWAIFDTPTLKLLTSFFVVVAFHDLLMKPIFKWFGFEYDDK